MVRLIVLGHWGLAAALVKSVEAVMGPQAGLYPLDFVQGDTADSFVRELTLLAANSLEYLILTDSPESLITRLAKETVSGPVVTGLSLPMLAALCQNRGSHVDPSALAELAISSGQQAVRLL